MNYIAFMASVLVTGASRGFGRELLDVYAGNGWTVFPLIRNRAIADDLSRMYTPKCFPIVADVSSDSAMKAISVVLKKHGAVLDLLINNAGNINKNRGLTNTTPEELIELFDVHCAGVLRCTKATIPFLKKASMPVVINITSRWGSIKMTTEGKGGLGGIIYSYKIAKCAQNMLTACLNHDLKADNIKVFAIHPGRLKTSVAPADADIDPKDAAARLYNWVEKLNDTFDCQCFDLMSGSIIDW